MMLLCCYTVCAVSQDILLALGANLTLIGAIV